MSRLLAASRPPPAALALLALAAVALAVAGYLHARLLHRGYAEVDVVGPLFALNAVATAVVVVALVFDRPVLFVLGSLGISVGSLGSILVSHTWSFFGFAEGGYDATAELIVATEVAAVVLTLMGVAAGGLRRGAQARGAA